MQNRVEEIILLTNEEKTQHQQSSTGPYRKKFIGIIKPNNRQDCYKTFLLWIILFGSLFVLVAPLALHLSYALPNIKPRTIPSTEFSEERARDFFPNLTQYGPRVSNTYADYMTRRFLISEISRLQSLADPSIRFELSLQNFTMDGDENLQNIAVRISNVVSSVDCPSLMLVAHYDSVEFSLGGSDDGSGLVTILEILSNLIHDRRIDFAKVNLIVLFTAAEEMGFKGSGKFVAEHPWKNEIRRFINLDSTGGQEKAILFRVKPSQLVKDYGRVPRPHANVIGDEILDYVSSDTDYSVFTSEGSLMGYDFAFYLDGYNYHTSLDEPSIVENGALQHLGENTLVLTRQILRGQVNLDEPVSIVDDDHLIYFDVLGRHLITYRQSTSVTLQFFLIGLVVLIGFFRILMDHFWYNKHPTINDTSSVYFYFKNPLVIRLLSILIFFFGYVLSLVMSIVFSASIAFILSKIRNLSWYGNSTLAFFLFGLPCCIGLVLCEALWRYLRRSFLARYPKKTPMEIKMISHIDLQCFNFERHWALLLVFVLLMIVSITTNFRSLYLILLWASFICPIYCLIFGIEFVLRWSRIKLSILLNDPEWYWLFAPYIVSLVPLIHTFEMTSRLTRLAIPILVRPDHSSFVPADLILCILIVLPAVIFLLMFIPNVQKTMNFTRILLLLTVSFIIVLIVAFNRQIFSRKHPLIVHIVENSQARVDIDGSSMLPLQMAVHSEKSPIYIQSSPEVFLSSILKRIDQNNVSCSNRNSCSINNSFNTTTMFREIELTQITEKKTFRFICRHLSTFQIEVKSSSAQSLVVINASEQPRSETIVDVVPFEFLSSFQFAIFIQRCDVNESEFLQFFTSKFPNLVLGGRGRCRSISDSLIVKVRL